MDKCRPDIVPFLKLVAIEALAKAKIAVESTGYFSYVFDFSDWSIVVLVRRYRCRTVIDDFREGCPRGVGCPSLL